MNSERTEYTAIARRRSWRHRVAVPAPDQVVRLTDNRVQFDDGVHAQCAIGGLWSANLGHSLEGHSLDEVATIGDRPHRGEIQQLLRQLLIDVVDVDDWGHVLFTPDEDAARRLLADLIELSGRVPLMVDNQALVGGELPGERRRWTATDDDVLVADETESGLRWPAGLFRFRSWNRRPDAVILGPGIANGLSDTSALVLGRAFHPILVDVVGCRLNDGESRAMLAVARHYRSPGFQRAMGRNANLLSRGVRALAGEGLVEVVDPIVADGTLALRASWDYVLRVALQEPATLDDPGAGLVDLLEQFRREGVWLGGIHPDLVVVMPPVTSSAGDVARIVDALHVVLRRC